MEAQRLRRMLPAGSRLVRGVRVLEHTSSTNDWLKQRLQQGDDAAAGLLVVAEQQSAGRGRRQRDWWSGPAGANLSFSIGVERAPQPAECLGLHAACAWADALLPLLGDGRRAALKWPNDLLLDGAKAGGILVERPAAAPEGFAVLGIGLNVNAAPPAEVAPYATTCIARSGVMDSDTGSVRGATVDRSALLARLLWALDRRLCQHQRCGAARLEQDFLALLRRWAPAGIMECRTGVAGPLLEFSVLEGLTWGKENRTVTRPLGWIDSLQPLPTPAP